MFPWIATPKGLKVSKVDSEFNSLLLVSTLKTEIVSQDSHPKVSKTETKAYSKQQAVKHEMTRPTVPTARRPNPHWWGTATPWRGCSKSGRFMAKQQGFFLCQWACENWSSLEQTIQFQGYAEACGSPSHVLPRLFDEGGKPRGQYLDSLDSKDGGWSPLTSQQIDGNWNIVGHLLANYQLLNNQSITIPL